MKFLLKAMCIYFIFEQLYERKWGSKEPKRILAAYSISVTINIVMINLYIPL